MYANPQSEKRERERYTREGARRVLSLTPLGVNYVKERGTRERKKSGERLPVTIVESELEIVVGEREKKGCAWRIESFCGACSGGPQGCVRQTCFNVLRGGEKKWLFVAGLIKLR